MKNPYKTRDKRGRLTAYAFVLGYIERYGDNVTVHFDLNGGFYVATIWTGTKYKTVTRKTLEGIRMVARDSK